MADGGRIDVQLVVLSTIAHKGGGGGSMEGWYRMYMKRATDASAVHLLDVLVLVVVILAFLSLGGTACVSLRYALRYGMCFIHAGFTLTVPAWFCRRCSCCSWPPAS